VAFQQRLPDAAVDDGRPGAHGGRPHREEARSARDEVVRRLPGAVARSCARSGCSAPAAATLSFSYAERWARLSEVAPETRPQAYELCLAHATRTRAPRGWRLIDERDDAPPPTGPTVGSAGPGGDRPVAVLAATPPAAPDPVSEDAVGGATEVTSGSAIHADPEPLGRPVPATRW
jgi:hypothetical protein